MVTYMPKSAEVKRDWYVIDAAGCPLGRVAVQAAILLRGKHKVLFTPHVDCGDHVVVINCDKAILTGKKLEKKCRYRYTGYVGNLKTIRYSDLMKRHPERAMQLAVKGMIPNTSLGRKEMLRLRAVNGSEHAYCSQKPQLWGAK